MIKNYSSQFMSLISMMIHRITWGLLIIFHLDIKTFILVLKISHFMISRSVLAVNCLITLTLIVISVKYVILGLSLILMNINANSSQQGINTTTIWLIWRIIKGRFQHIIHHYRHVLHCIHFSMDKVVLSAAYRNMQI